MDFLTNLIQQPVTLRSKQTELTPAIILDATLTFLLEFLTVNSIQFGFFTLSVYLLRGLQIFIKTRPVLGIAFLLKETMISLLKIFIKNIMIMMVIIFTKVLWLSLFLCLVLLLCLVELSVGELAD